MYCSGSCCCSCNCLSIYRSIYLSIYLFVCLSVCLSASLKTQQILRDVLNFWTWQRQKRSNSARRPQFLNLTTSKTKQFCETSSIFELDNVKNETILRGLLNFRSWPHQKRNNSARHPSKMESWVQSWRPLNNAFCDFFHSACLKYCACHEKVMPGHTKCCNCQAKSSQQTWRSDAPKCNPSQEISALTS